MNFVRELKAKSTLGMALVKNVLVLPFRRSGSPGWLGPLAEEGLMPTAPETWQRLESTSRCIACGLCDVTGAADEASPSGTIMAAARRPEDAPLVVEAAGSLAQRAAAIARICPAGVPAEEVARLIEDNAAALTTLPTRR